MSESDRDGQVEELWCGEGRSLTQCRTPSAKVSEQSGREFTSGNEVARACHETIQVTGPRSVFSRPSELFPRTSEWADTFTELADTAMS